jgi:transcriptional regulator with XRE-family HTH domain
MADRLRKSLRETDIGVQEMADYLGVSRNTVSAWINGRGPINPECLPKWAELTGFPQKWIENGDTPGGPMPPRPPGVLARRHPKARTHLRAVTEVAERQRELVDAVDDNAQGWLRLVADDAISPTDKTVGKFRRPHYPAVTAVPATYQRAA